MNKILHFGIGFITGRPNICEIINNTYKFLLKQIQKKNIELTIFILFDMEFQNAKREEFYRLNPEVSKNIDIKYITPEDIQNEKEKLIEKSSIKEDEADLFFGYGYGKARNTLMYMAVKNKIDYFLFWDDDEYPVACFKDENGKIEWKMQNNILEHIENMKNADITLGLRCGYTSPIPYINLDTVEDISAVEAFINAVKNEFTSWEKVKQFWLSSEGITYADKEVINKRKKLKTNKEVMLSGSPLCLNLQNVQKMPAFYNPEGARGEDIFFKLALKEVKVMEIPVYHFHDPFLRYTYILKKQYPDKMEVGKITDKAVTKRFITASKGWIKYRPLYLYIINKDTYDKEIEQTRKNLEKAIPEMDKIFHTHKFNNLIAELDKYDKNVEKDYEQFLNVNKTWEKLKSII